VFGLDVLAPDVFAPDVFAPDVFALDVFASGGETFNRESSGPGDRLAPVAAISRGSTIRDRRGENRRRGGMSIPQERRRNGPVFI
jgi:hypothetical protein